MQTAAQRMNVSDSRSGLVTTVSVIVPCRNERDHIEGFLESLLRQERAGLWVEYLIADGMSDDGTQEILRAVAARHPEMRIIRNEGRIVSTGLNRAIREARGDIIVRMDAHTEYAPDYIRECVRCLEETGADNVGGPARTRARSLMQQAIALAFHSRFSTGGARFHDPQFEGQVDTVTYGCWRKETLERLGLFDEELVRNQDDELNLRITRSGGKVYQSPRIQSWYYPRPSLGALFRQYAQYGFWKVRLIQKHRLPASWRHPVPVLFLIWLLLLLKASPFLPRAALVLGGTLALYCLALLATSVATCARSGQWRCLPLLPVVFAMFHFGYGWGSLCGLVKFWLLRRGPRGAFTELTRNPDNKG